MAWKNTQTNPIRMIQLQLRRFCWVDVAVRSDCRWKQHNIQEQHQHHRHGGVVGSRLRVRALLFVYIFAFCSVFPSFCPASSTRSRDRSLGGNPLRCDLLLASSSHRWLKRNKSAKTDHLEVVWNLITQVPPGAGHGHHHVPRHCRRRVCRSTPPPALQLH